MDYNFLSKTALFQELSPEEVETVLSCLGATQKIYAKDSVLLHAGDDIHTLGMILSGSVTIEIDDIWGNKSLLNQIAKGHVFAEAYACAKVPAIVTVVALEETRVLFLPIERLLQSCSCTCSFHRKLIQNLLSISTQKNLHLSRRILHTSSKTIRGRLLSYLSDQAILHGTLQFTIPLSRQQLADYLNVERSAMSHALSKMQRDGLLTVNKNYFHLQPSFQDCTFLQQD